MRPRAAIVLALAVATFGVYFRVVDHAFLEFDDARYILENPQVVDGFSLRAARDAFAEPYSLNWIPLTTISWQIDRSLYGTNPAGFHLTNVALHAISAIVLFLALARMTGASGCSAFVAGVFALHPLHVESVAWAAERKDTLSGLFWMLSLLAYARYAQRPGTLRYLAVVLCFAAGLLAKPMLVTLPFALLLLDYWPLARLGAPSGGVGSASGNGSGGGGGSSVGHWLRSAPVRRRILEKLPLLAMAAVASAVTFAVQRAGGAMHFGDRIPAGQRLGNALESYVVYAIKSVWPTGLAAYYPHPLDDLSMGVALAAGMALAVTTVAALSLAVSRPYLIVGWLWYLGTLVPVIGLVQVGSQARADRYTYIPLIGLSVAAAWGARDLLAPRLVGPRALARIGVAALAALAVVSWFQLRYWRDTIALHERNLAVTEDNPRAHYGLAMALAGAGRADEAERHFEEAIALAPRWALPRVELANLRADRGDDDDALGGYAEAIALDPDNGVAHARSGLLLARLGRSAEAREHFERALAIHAVSPDLQRRWGGPQLAALHMGLANAAALAGENELALAGYERALALDPEQPLARANRGLTLMRSGQPERALPDLEWAAARTPDSLELQIGVAMVAESLGRPALAVRHYRAVLDLAPGLRVAANNLAWLLATNDDPGLGSPQEAVRLAEGLADSATGDDPALLDTLGASYAAAGRFEEAARSAERAAELAEENGDLALAAEVRGHLALYRASRPYRAPATPAP